jgi:hypothetical protein
MTAFITHMSTAILGGTRARRAAFCARRDPRMAANNDDTDFAAPPRRPTPPKTPAPPTPPTSPTAPSPQTQPSLRAPVPMPSTPAAPADDAPKAVLRAPNDATPFRNESEVRRNTPAKREPRRRRRGARGADAGPVLEWDKMDSVPLVSGGGDQDGWVDLKVESEKKRRANVSRERLERSRGKVDDNMKQRLKKEVVQPYEDNWILWIIAFIAFLAVAFKLSGGFDTIPVIRVPDI